MPHQHVENLTTTFPLSASAFHQDYNLSRLSNSNPANGFSVQANYTFGTAASAVIKLQASNDGVNFGDISGSSVTVTSTGSTIYDLGFPHYKWLRVLFTPSGGTISAVLIDNATNLS